MSFPKNFLWGGATASNQYEGGVFEGDAALSTADVMTNGSHTVKRQVTWRMPDGTEGGTPLCFGSSARHLPEGAVPMVLDDPKYYYPSHIASDFYHHYKEDIRLMAEEGFKSLRISVKWSRILPDPYGEPSECGMQFYDDVFDECLKYGIEPLVTLHHYETPLLFAQKCNGWDSREPVDLFEKYARVCFERYKGKVKYYLTFNEINHIETAPFACGGLIHADPQNIANAGYHQFVASAKAVMAAHEVSDDIKVGMMLAFSPSYALTADPADQLYAAKRQNNTLFFSDVQMLGEYPCYKLREYEREGIVLPVMEGDTELLKKGVCDFLSFSTYGSHTYTTHSEDAQKGEGNGADGRSVKNPYLKTNAWGWGIDPQSMRLAMNIFHNRYHCPLWCVENGIGWNDVFEDGTVHDDYRIHYMRVNIQSMKDAIELDGIDLMGYLYWGCVDMVSNSEGEMAKRYGQIYVDADNYGQGSMKRYTKDSYYWYQKVIASNGEDLS